MFFYVLSFIHFTEGEYGAVNSRRHVIAIVIQWIVLYRAWSCISQLRANSVKLLSQWLASGRLHYSYIQGKERAPPTTEREDCWYKKNDHDVTKIKANDSSKYTHIFLSHTVGALNIKNWLVYSRIHEGFKRMMDSMRSRQICTVHHTLSCLMKWRLVWFEK